MGMVTVAERRYAENTHEYTARPRSSPMMVGIAVETTVDSSEASAVTRTSAKVTARTRSGAKRAPGSTATSAASSVEAGKRPIIGHPAAKEGPTKTSRRPAVLGLRAHSGWAALVAVGGSAPAPEVVDCRRIEMADDPEAKQPYHAAEELTLPKAAGLLERLSRKARERAAPGRGAALPGRAGRRQRRPSPPRHAHSREGAAGAGGGGPAPPGEGSAGRGGRLGQGARTALDAGSEAERARGLDGARGSKILTR